MSRVAFFSIIFCFTSFAQIGPVGGGGGGGSATPGPPVGSVQFNKAGALGGDAAFGWLPFTTPAPGGGSGVVITNTPGVDPGGNTEGFLFNSTRYSDGSDISYTTNDFSTVITPTADNYGPYPADTRFYLELAGAHNWTNTAAAMGFLEYKSSGTVSNSLIGLYGFVDIGTGSTGSVAGTGLYGVAGIDGKAQTNGTGTIAQMTAVHGWLGAYTGTVGNLATFYASAPSTGATITGVNAAYLNENWGPGGFSWYSEGGILHSETGAAGNVGVEIEAHAAQTADLFRTLASDGTTVQPFRVLASGYAAQSLHTPASSAEACTAGQFTDDAFFHYVCTATNTWKRVALSAF